MNVRVFLRRPPRRIELWMGIDAGCVRVTDDTLHILAGDNDPPPLAVYPLAHVAEIRVDDEGAVP